jgi:signal transduction histidine kinase
VKVRADREGLMKSTEHLVRNAVEAMESGGALTVGLEQGEGQATIRVSDTGSGIMEAVGRRMFELYFTTKPQHLGLGLSQALIFCETHGGRVTWQSGADGTRFTLTLPTAQHALL